MEKINFKKELSNLYSASVKKPELIKVPKMNFLMVEGFGTPRENEFQNAAKTLYPLAYTLKFMIREIKDIDYGVLPMEVIWTLNRKKKGDFKWVMMLMQPKYITQKLYEEAYERVKIKFDPPLIKKVRFESFDEGLCVQVMHKGAYEKMNDTLENMLTFIKEHGYTSERDTHDIYLNDVRKTRPENLKTIMRLPVKK